MLDQKARTAQRKSEKNINDTQVLMIVDRSMLPVVRGVGGMVIGDTILISRDQAPSAGCLVVAQIHGQHPMVRRYIPKSATSYDLVPTNPDYRTESITKARTAKIIGVVLEHRRRLFPVRNPVN